MRNGLIILIFLFCSSFVNAQNYDTTKVQIFINQVLKEKFNDTTNIKVYLISEVYNTILPSESRKQEIYSELKEYMTKNEIDKQLEYCSLLSSSFKYINQSISFEVISDSEATEKIEKSTVILVDSNKRKRVKCKKTNTKKIVVIKTSTPLFIDENLCLILLSSTSGNTTSASCLYLYKKQIDGNWQLEKVVLCSYG